MDDKQHRRTVKTLAALFRNEQVARPILLLGAGASACSGVPTAAELVQRLARYAFSIEKYGNENAFLLVQPSDWTPFLQNQPWYIPNRLAENFPLAVQHFLRPQDRRRRLLKHEIKYSNISSGYRALTQMVLRRLCSTIMTTNFDEVLKDALSEFKTHLRDIVEVNCTRGDLVRFHSRNPCQIIYLHGSVDYYTDCNIDDEIQKLNEDLAERLWPILAEAPLIVVGYRGSEPSIADHLLGKGIKRSFGFKYGIYWCSRDDNLHPKVTALQKQLGANFFSLGIKGFDELMTDLDTELKGEVLYVEPDPDEKAKRTWDSLPAKAASMLDVDEPLMLATLTEYCNRLKLTLIARESWEPFLLNLRLAVRENGQLVPTNGCILLFGKNPQERFSHALVTFIAQKKKQTLFQGNLLKQRQDLAELLQDESINPTLRLKNETGAEEQLAFPKRALVELVANLLVHRDYESSEFSKIEQEPGESLTFSNPGGLPERIRNMVKVQPDGTFDPVRGESECRNAIIADIFFGISQIDKAGSGLPDVQALMPKHGGRAEFICQRDNLGISVRLWQAEQKAPKNKVAIRRTDTEVYITNLLPFKAIPPKVYQMPLRTPKTKLTFESDDERDSLPVCIAPQGWLLSFGDLRRAPAFAERHGSVEHIREWDTSEFIQDPDRRRHFVWLVGRHWGFFLGRFRENGLWDDFKKKRAFFHLIKGEENTIKYISRMGRNVSRDVVKSRGENGEEHENEGIYYQIVQMSDEWAVQIKPTYVFTTSDGKTPLPARFQTNRATRRFKFDRNKSVDDDLTFWSRYFGKEGEAINLGRGWDDDLVLEIKFLFVELATEKPVA